MSNTLTSGKEEIRPSEISSLEVALSNSFKSFSFAEKDLKKSYALNATLKRVLGRSFGDQPKASEVAQAILALNKPMWALETAQVKNETNTLVRTLAQLKFQPRKILDVGTGAGQVATALSEKLQIPAYGYDRQNYLLSDTLVTYKGDYQTFVEDCRGMGAREESCFLVIIRHSLHHMSQKLQMQILEALRCIKGQVYVFFREHVTSPISRHNANFVHWLYDLKSAVMSLDDYIVLNPLHYISKYDITKIVCQGKKNDNIFSLNGSELTYSFLMGVGSLFKTSEPQKTTSPRSNPCMEKLLSLDWGTCTDDDLVAPLNVKGLKVVPGKARSKVGQDKKQHPTEKTMKPQTKEKTTSPPPVPTNSKPVREDLCLDVGLDALSREEGDSETGSKSTSDDAKEEQDKRKKYFRLKNHKKFCMPKTAEVLAKKMLLHDMMKFSPQLGNTHPFSSFFRYEAEKFVFTTMVNTLPIPDKGLRVVDYFGSPRTAKWKQENIINIQNCGDLASFEGDAARSERESMPLWYDSALIQDVYGDPFEPRNPLTTKTLHRVISKSTCKVIYMIMRRFEGNAGMDSNQYDEGMWVRTPQGIFFSAAPNDQPYNPHPDPAYLFNHRSIDGISISQLRTFGPFYVLRLALEKDSFNLLPPIPHMATGLVATVELDDATPSTWNTLKSWCGFETKKICMGLRSYFALKKFRV